MKILKELRSALAWQLICWSFKLMPDDDINKVTFAESIYKMVSKELKL